MLLWRENGNSYYSFTQLPSLSKCSVVRLWLLHLYLPHSQESHASTCACKSRSESCFLIWKKTLTKIGWYSLLSYTQLLRSALPSFIISCDFLLKQPLWLGQCASLSLRLLIMWRAKKTHKAAGSMWTVDVHFSNAFFPLKLYLMPPLSLYNILLSFLLYVFPSFTLHHGDAWILSYSSLSHSSKILL